VNGKIGCIDVGFKKFWLEFTEIKCFEIGLCDGKNQLLQFWSERFMPNAFENPEGSSFGNVCIL
jgi:hypothetical protein